MREIHWHDYKLTHIIKIGPKNSRITSLFCLRQQLRDNVIDFSKFGQLKFCLYLLNSLLSQNPLPLVWKLLSSSFKISKNHGVITIHFLQTWAYFLNDYSKIYFYLIAIAYSKIIQSTQKWVRACSNMLWTFPIFFKKIWLCDAKWDWMMPPDAFFLKSINCWRQQKCRMKGAQFEKKNIIAF